MYTIRSLFFLISSALAASQVPPDAIAQQHSLSTSTSLPFPSATQSTADTENHLVSQWSLNKARIQDGSQNLDFVNDPFPNKPPTGAPGVISPTGPVLRVTYPEGSFSHDTGGVQFYSLWNTTDDSQFHSMMVSYELAFDPGFDWVGNKATGLDCFSSRLMWRKNGAGEVYAYIPTPNNLCNDPAITCNSDFGVSISRSSFGFVAGHWNRVTMVVQLNNPPNVANGYIALYFNDILAVSQQNLQIRASSSVAANGFYFSTFFGGSDTSWATPVNAHTYFRNIRLWGSSEPSKLTGQLVSSAPRSVAASWLSVTLSVLVAAAGLALCY